MRLRRFFKLRRSSKAKSETALASSETSSEFCTMESRTINTNEKAVTFVQEKIKMPFLKPSSTDTLDELMELKEEATVESESSNSEDAGGKSDELKMVLLTDDSSFSDSDDNPVDNLSTEEAGINSREVKAVAYVSKRDMTPTQERWNAITILPNPFVCVYFLLAGMWVSDELIMEAQDRVLSEFNDERMSECFSSSLFPHLYAMPPLPLIAIVAAIVVHAPFSFLYHWTYAHRLPPGMGRIEHWSRRLDNSFIHVASAFISYGTSGQLDFFLANLLFNMDCIYRQLFEPKVIPRRNQSRIFLSMVGYTLPVLRNGQVGLYLQIWAVLAISGWLFAAYPIGGWSHSAFHIGIAMLPPLLMKAALALPSSQDPIHFAAQCAAHQSIS